MTAPDTQRLQDRIEELEQLLGMRPTLPRAWGMTPREAALFGLLLRHQVVSSDFAIAAIWGGDGETSSKSVQVMIHKLRRRLAPVGLAIKTEFNTGYFLADKRLARALIASHQQVAA